MCQMLSRITKSDTEIPLTFLNKEPARTIVEG